MNLPFFIARRYLFAKKSHNVINIISAISAIGMAIGTAALIIILSVYNGFDSLIKSNLSDLDPDILITPASGKVFVPALEDLAWLENKEGVEGICTYLQDNVFVGYEGQQEIAIARGVDNLYEERSKIRDHVVNGDFKLHFGEVPMCAVGAGFAYSMGINPRFVSAMEIYYPDREKNISMANPAASLHKVKLHPSCTFSIHSEMDNSLIILPIGEMRKLLAYDEEVSALEVRVSDCCSRKDLRVLIREIGAHFGDNYKVSDRYRQNESLYKMMRYEKAAIFVLLIFIIIIIAFNIFGSLSMLIIEKQGDITTLESMGAQERLIRKIFILEGWLISLFGLVCGLAIGLAFALIQQKFGLIHMPGNYLISSYPVIIKWQDIVLTAAGVATVGYLIALLPVASFYSKDKK